MNVRGEQGLRMRGFYRPTNQDYASNQLREDGRFDGE